MASTRANNQTYSQQLMDRGAGLESVRQQAVERKADPAYQTPVQQAGLDKVIADLDHQEAAVADESLLRSNLEEAYAAAAAKTPRPVNLDNDPGVKRQWRSSKSYREQHKADYPKHSLSTGCVPCAQASLNKVQPWAYTASTNVQYDGMYAPKGKGYKAEQVASYSHYNVPIDTAEGRPAGNSRIWGDAPPETQKASIDAILKSAEAQGLTRDETAHVLAIAYTESGFKPRCRGRHHFGIGPRAIHQ